MAAVVENEYLELLGFYREGRLRGWKNRVANGKYIVVLDAGPVCLMRTEDALGPAREEKRLPADCDITETVVSWMYGAD